MAETDALSGAKFGGGLYLKDFPVKVRVLTRDPMVYVDNFGNTKYVFAVFNLDEQKVQILDKGPGFASRFQEINADEDFGGDVRKIDLKITTNGKSGMERRYTITPVGSPSELTKEQQKLVKEQGFDLAEKVQKNNPNALRLSEINAGAKLAAPEVEDMSEEDAAAAAEAIGDEPINLDDIPF